MSFYLQNNTINESSTECFIENNLKNLTTKEYKTKKTTEEYKTEETTTEEYKTKETTTEETTTEEYKTEETTTEEYKTKETTTKEYKTEETTTEEYKTEETTTEEYEIMEEDKKQINYIDSSFNIDILPQKISICTMSLACQLGSKFKLNNIYKYIQLETNNIVAIKCEKGVRCIGKIKEKFKSTNKNYKKLFSNQYTIIIQISETIFLNVN